ncbi:type III secretion system protein SsaL [Vibrio zhanjiangensis]|uniref:Type III secretion system protein SsaL n=1 Tax=Vibrio zhanjiangensis TaxID=1046128 RepID=A0ABQ6F151_9VIBR|nr:TyeA family type III secretion system gatekeeper subunit [Vibrio zhanjiangensis]GLT18656.1 type III secretion system protein SsaL [Vibrio zhanjiangensis]
MRVDANLHTEFNAFSHNQTSSVVTTESTASLATAALAEVRQEALEETMEGLSLGLSSVMKKLNLEHKDPMFNGMERILQQMDKMARQSINHMTEQLSQLKTANQIFAALEQSGLEKGKIALILTSLMSFKGLSPSIKKELKKRLSEILDEEGIDLEVIAAAQGMNIDKEGLRALRQLYQYAKRGEQGLAHWFELLEQQKDRRQYIRILIRSMSEPLDEGQKRDDMTMVAAVVADLKRLLLFLTFEDHCGALARAMGVEVSSVMSATIELLEQSWVYPDFLSLIIERLGLASERKVIFLRRWKDLLAVMSQACFRDPEQKEHVQETMLELLDQWNE